MSSVITPSSVILTWVFSVPLILGLSVKHFLLLFIFICICPIYPNRLWAPEGGGCVSQLLAMCLMLNGCLNSSCWGLGHCLVRNTASPSPEQRIICGTDATVERVPLHKREHISVMIPYIFNNLSPCTGANWNRSSQ